MPSHDVNKIRTRSYRFSGYQLKRDRNNNIVEPMPKHPTTPYPRRTANATPGTPPVPEIKSGNIKDNG